MEKSFETPGPVALDLRVPAGEIQIDPSLDGRVEVELIAHDDESQRQVEESRVELRERDGRYEVLVDVPLKTGRGFGFTISFGRQGIICRVRCPEGSTLQVRSKSADVEAIGTMGNVSVQTASGDVRLRRVEGSLNTKSASGDVRVETVTGTAVVQSASGDVELDAVGGELRVNSVSGDVSIGSAAGKVSATTVSGDQAHERVSNGPVSANSVSGDVRIAVQRGARVYLDCTSVSGDTRSELELSGEPSGDGPLVEIRAKTVSGDIRIARASASANDSQQEVHA
jgi:DUF4097 and DUF4098 domain-containing protein YvlB